MESNEQTKLTSKIETDSQTEGRMTAKVGRGRLRGRGIEQKKKKDSWTWTTVW